MTTATPSRPNTVRRTLALLGGPTRVVLSLTMGFVLCWLSLVVATNTVFGRRTPALAGALGWTGSEALATEARTLLGANVSSAALARAEALARHSLDRELLNGRAASTLASVADLQGDRAQADRLFRFTESITRRDTLTQLWLLESAVERGDIPGAIHHYDRAMTVSPPSWGVLVPVLAAAAANPPVARAIAARLKFRPNWWTAFTDRLIATGNAPTTSLPIVLSALRLDPSNPVDLPFLVHGMDMLVKARAYDAAWSLYRRATGASADARQGLRNGDFEAAVRVAPFDWSLSDEEGLSAVVQLREGSGAGNALYLSSDAGRTGEVARQLLLLGPGRYTLSGTVGGSAQKVDRPEVLVTCAEAKTPAVQAVLPPAPPEGRRFTITVSIPSTACSAQWLSIRAHAPLDIAAPEVWIDMLSLQRG